MKGFVKVSLLICLFSFSFFIKSVSAQEYDLEKLPQKSSYSAFWLSGVIPNIDSKFSAGQTNKVNYEYWFNVNNNSGYWIEMGFHKGYGFKSDGSGGDINTYYAGLFVAGNTEDGYFVTPFSSYAWGAGQSHTMGNTCVYVPSNGSNVCHMNTDSQTIVTIGDVGTSNTGTIDAGLEWSWTTTAKPTVSNASMTKMQVLDSGTWKTWGSIGGVSGSNSSLTPITPSFNSSTNTITLNN